MDTRFVLLGILGNLCSMLFIFIGFAEDTLLFILTISMVIIAAILNALGLARKGSVSADVSGGIIFGNFSVVIFNLLFLLWSIVGYQEGVSFCQLGSGYAPSRCTQASDDLIIAGVLVVSLIVTATVSVASLLNLKRLSET